MLQVIKIKFEPAQHLLRRIRIAIIERRIRRYTRPDLIQKRVARISANDLFNIEATLRTRTDKSHIAAQDVPQLRQLVQMMLAQEAAYARQARVFAPTTKLRATRFGVIMHAAKLIHGKGAAVAADARLLEEGGRAIVKPHGKIASQHNRRKKQQAKERDGYIGHPLQQALCAVHTIWYCGSYRISLHGLGLSPQPLHKRASERLRDLNRQRAAGRRKNLRRGQRSKICQGEVPKPARGLHEKTANQGLL